MQKPSHTMSFGAVMLVIALTILSEPALGSVAMGGGDSFENATEAWEGELPIGGGVGNTKYLYILVDGGNLVSIENPCGGNDALRVYDENLQPIANGENGTAKWSANSENQTHRIYFTILLCNDVVRIKVQFENRQDMNSGKDAGENFTGAVAASGGANYNCCHLSLNNSIEGGNDKGDMYSLKTSPGRRVTVDTMAPLEIIAYAADGTELARGENKISFMPQSQNAYVLVRTTTEFSGGQNSSYSLIIEGVEQEEAGAGSMQQQQQAPAGGEKNGTRRGVRSNITAGTAANESLNEETPAGKGALEAISDQILGTIKRAEQDYGVANISGQRTESPQGGEAASKKAIVIVIAVVALFLLVRARKSA